MRMGQKQEIERTLRNIIRRCCDAESLQEMTNIVNSARLAIDSLLWEQDEEGEKEWHGLQEKTQHGERIVSKSEHTRTTRQVNIAIDGPCGGGKTTLGTILQELYDCNLFHMDDFFLRKEQRTPARYQEPGGNVDYERFKAEVLDHLSDREGLVYRRFDCGTMSLGERRKVPYKNLNIIEGAYSCHPYFGEEVYALRFFVDIEPCRQRERIIARSGEEMWKRFASEWIPMENKYFDMLEIRKKCIVVCLTA